MRAGSRDAYCSWRCSRSGTATGCATSSAGGGSAPSRCSCSPGASSSSSATAGRCAALLRRPASMPILALHGGLPRVVRVVRLPARRRCSAAASSSRPRPSRSGSCLARPPVRLAVIFFAIMLQARSGALAAVRARRRRSPPPARSCRSGRTTARTCPAPTTGVSGLLFHGRPHPGLRRRTRTCSASMRCSVRYSPACCSSAGWIGRRLAVPESGPRRAGAGADPLRDRVHRGRHRHRRPRPGDGVPPHAPRRPVIVGVVAAVLVVGAGLSSSRLSEPLLALLGKGDDFTGRLEIWRARRRPRRPEARVRLGMGQLVGAVDGPVQPARRPLTACSTCRRTTPTSTSSSSSGSPA